MPRKPSPEKQRAFELYAGGMRKLRDIASELGVPEKTVAVWKSRGKWDDTLPVKATANNKKPTKKDCSTTKEKCSTTNTGGASPPEGVPSPANDVDLEMLLALDANGNLTEMQKLFCFHFVNCHIATTAAKKAGYSKKSAGQLGYQLLQIPSIKMEIARLKEMKRASLLLEKEDIVEMYMRIAFSDMTDFVEFHTVTEPVMGMYGPVKIKQKDPETGDDKERYLMQEVNKILFRPSDEVDGMLITEISEGRQGTKIKLEDRQKALKWLADYFMMNPMDQHKVEYDAKKLALEELRAAGDTPSNEVVDDWISAMQEVMGEVADEEPVPDVPEQDPVANE